MLEVINRCRWGESAERGGNVLGRAMRASLLRWFEPAFSTINVDICILNIYFLHQTTTEVLGVPVDIYLSLKTISGPQS